MRLSYKSYVPLGIITICLLLYGNTLKNRYSLDDDLIFSKEFLTEGFKAIPKAFSERYVSNSRQDYGYRPIVITSYIIEISLFGQHLWISHAINVVLYAFTGVLLWLILLGLFKNHHWVLPSLVTLLFLIHPIHTEVVASLKNRDELLSFLFALTALFLFLKVNSQSPTWRLVLYWILGACCFSLSILSKPSNLTFLAIIPLALYFFTSIRWKKIAAVFSTLALVTIVTRLMVQNSLGPAGASAREKLFFENPWYQEMPNIIDRIPMLFYSLGFYLKTLLFPYPLRYYYGYDQVSMANWGTPLAWVCILFFCGITFLALRSLKKKKIWVFGFLFFIIAISPFTNFVKPAPGIVAERFAYGATLGFAILLALGIILLTSGKERSSEKAFPIGRKKLFYSLLVLLVGVSVVYSVQRNSKWESGLVLYESDYTHLKKSAKGLSLYANELYLKANQLQREIESSSHSRSAKITERARYIDKSIEVYQQALAIYPEYTSTLNNMASAYLLQKGHYMTLLAMERRKSQQNDALMNKLSESIKTSHNHAETSLLNALKLDSLHTAAYFNLGKLYSSDNNTAKASSYYRKALETEPGFIPAFDALLLVYEQELRFMKNQGIPTEAWIQELVELCESISPDPAYKQNAQIWTVMGSCYMQLGQHEKQIDVLSKALGILQGQMSSVTKHDPSFQKQQKEYDLIKSEVLQRMEQLGRHPDSISAFNRKF